MGNFAAAKNTFRLFDELASRKTIVHRLHPVTKLLTTLAFLIATLSFGKYEVAALLPLVLYPLTLIILADLPAGQLLKRMLPVAPLALGIGVFNPLFDRSPALTVGTLIVSGGWVSLITIMLRFGLTVLAGLILIATSGLNELAGALLKLRLPRPLVTQLLFMYRYLSVLGEEAARIARAYSLRALEKSGIQFNAWGSLAGQLLLRSIDRAERIYQAMLCRGFDGRINLPRRDRFEWRDLLYFLGWVVFFGAVRFYNIPRGIGSIIMGVGK